MVKAGARSSVIKVRRSSATSKWAGSSTASPWTTLAIVPGRRCVPLDVLVRGNLRLLLLGGGVVLSGELDVDSFCYCMVAVASSCCCSLLLVFPMSSFMRAPMSCMPMARKCVLLQAWRVLGGGFLGCCVRRSLRGLGVAHGPRLQQRPSDTLPSLP